MALGVVTYFLPIGIVSTLTAHHVRQRGLNSWLWRWIAYLEIHLPIGSGLVFFSMYIPMMIFMYLVMDGHFSDAAFALTISILLTLIAFNALQLRAALREWPWWLRLMIFTIWAGSVAIATWTIVNN